MQTPRSPCLIRKTSWVSSCPLTHATEMFSKFPSYVRQHSTVDPRTFPPWLKLCVPLSEVFSIRVQTRDRVMFKVTHPSSTRRSVTYWRKSLSLSFVTFEVRKIVSPRVSGAEQSHVGKSPSWRAGHNRCQRHARASAVQCQD